MCERAREERVTRMYTVLYGGRKGHSARTKKFAPCACHIALHVRRVAERVLRVCATSLSTCSAFACAYNTTTYCVPYGGVTRASTLLSSNVVTSLESDLILCYNNLYKCNPNIELLRFCYNDGVVYGSQRIWYCSVYISCHNTRAYKKRK